ncbi:MAG: hypothetical protein R3C31_13025 [Hyphomonadaceae bacterium]
MARVKRLIALARYSLWRMEIAGGQSSMHRLLQALRAALSPHVFIDQAQAAASRLAQAFDGDPGDAQHLGAQRRWRPCSSAGATRAAGRRGVRRSGASAQRAAVFSSTRRYRRRRAALSARARHQRNELLAPTIPTWPSASTTGPAAAGHQTASAKPSR